jgi:hypothetical protein
MPTYDFICSITIEADSEEEATRWFDYNTDNLDIYVSEIEVK